MTTMISVDLAVKGRTGVAQWRDQKLENVWKIEVGTKKKGKVWKLTNMQGETVVFHCFFSMWSALFDGVDLLVVEDSHIGINRQSSLALAEHRGTVMGIFLAFSSNQTLTDAILKVNPSSWRKSAEAAFNTTFPAGELAKTTAVAIVKENFNLSLSPDEAEAVLIGHWAIRARLIGDPDDKVDKN